MRNLLTKMFLASMLITGGAMVSTPAFAQVSLGIRIGAPPAPRVVRTRPRQPGPDYVWIDGYWYAQNGRYAWHDGYWTRPPYPAARWVAPRYEGGQFFAGYWDGNNGRIDHDHRWDKDKNRDWNRSTQGLRDNGDRDHHDDGDRDRH